MGGMPALFLLVFRFVRLLLSGHQAVAIENAALRIQLAVFQRKRKRLLLTTCDRVFWITLRSLWSDWRHPLMYVQADTVVRWQRERFRKFWARLSKPQRRRRGRPSTATELRRLMSKWPRPIRCGAHPGFTANSRCLASPSPSALYRASCAGSLGRLTRPGAPSCTTMSAKWYRLISLPCRQLP